MFCQDMIPKSFYHFAFFLELRHNLNDSLPGSGGYFLIFIGSYRLIKYVNNHGLP